ncbi:MAG: VCBS repeat-containing protein [Clostridium sp.]|uniref:VCBS repeat-containing protein n=1 Tax=Clostridium sp. TaxID=1506 RepID=UPI003D6D8237
MYNCYNRSNIIKPSIVSYAIGDVNGDRIADNVYLTGSLTVESPFIQNITLVIQDGKNGEFTSISLSENAGYNPTLFLGDFTGNHVDDILIGINTGGSGGIMYYYIYSFINNVAKLIFDYNVYNEEYKYNVAYKDNYKVQVVSYENNNEYIIDISNREIDYLNEIYYENGKLRNSINGFINPLSGLYPVDFDSDKVYELLAYQKIAGRYNADSLGYVLNTLKWKDNVFGLDNQNVAIFGSQK